MDKDRKIEELTKEVTQLQDENRQLQAMLQKVIKKYKKLKEKSTKLSNHEPGPKVTQKSENKTELPPQPKQPELPPPSTLPQLDPNMSGNILQSLEMDNLSFIQSAISIITLNYYFEDLGTCLIHEAVKAGSIKILHFICAKGADMNAKSKAGESALTIGAEENKHDAMCIILQQGREKLDLEYANSAGMTALQIAVKNGNKDIVSLLIAHGANVLATNFLGDSLIKMAQNLDPKQF